MDAKFLAALPPAGAEVWSDTRSSEIRENREAQQLAHFIRSGQRLSQEQMLTAIASAQCVSVRWDSLDRRHLLVSATLPSWLIDRTVMVRPTGGTAAFLGARAYRSRERGEFPRPFALTQSDGAEWVTLEVRVGTGWGAEFAGEYRGEISTRVLPPLTSGLEAQSTASQALNDEVRSAFSARIVWFSSDADQPYKAELCFRYVEGGGSALESLAFAFDVEILSGDVSLGSAAIVPRVAWRESTAPELRSQRIYEGRCLLGGISQDMLLTPRIRSGLRLRLRANESEARWQMSGVRPWQGELEMSLDEALANQLVESRPGRQRR